MSAMADVTPVRDEGVYDQLLHAVQSQGGWREKTMYFIDYLVAEDAAYCSVPDHVAFNGQRELRTKLERQSKLIGMAHA